MSVHRLILHGWVYNYISLYPSRSRADVSLLSPLGGGGMLHIYVDYYVSLSGKWYREVSIDAIKYARGDAFIDRACARVTYGDCASDAMCGVTLQNHGVSL